MKNCMMLNWKGLNGGPGGVRTLDLMTASHARSQLRHRPKLARKWSLPSLACRQRMCQRCHIAWRTAASYTLTEAAFDNADSTVRLLNNPLDIILLLGPLCKWRGLPRADRAKRVLPPQLKPLMSTLSTYILRMAEHKDQIAFIEQGVYRSREYGYQEVVERASAFAQWLRSKRLEAVPGQEPPRIVLWATPGAHWAMAFYGCVLAGAIAVPVDAGFSPEFLK